jgi:predicted nucleic acid-binding protein
LNGFIKPCYDQRIFTEYKEVLKRPKFNFTDWEIAALLSQIEHQGCSVVAEPLNLSFIDEDDLKFFEVARHCKARLITGNLRHYPDDPIVMSVANFLAMYFGDNADEYSGQDTTPAPK